MSWYQSIILAIVQGLTEFLPVSSSGHLNLAQYFFSLTPSLSFDIFLNTATLLSVLFFFRKQLKYFLENLKYIFVASLPAAIIGLLFKSAFESIYSDISLLPFFFFITSILLFSTRFSKQKSPLNFKTAILIGLAQALAILPGVSRSGATIATALLLGLTPLEAFSFSFCLFIPASLGALILDSKNIFSLSFTPQLFSSFILTFLVGVFALNLLKKAMIHQKFWYFGIYTFIVALLFFIVFL